MWTPWGQLAVTVLGIFGLAKMAFTGKQYGGKKLHMAYRLMILFIFLAVIGSYFIVLYSK